MKIHFLVTNKAIMLFLIFIIMENFEHLTVSPENSAVSKTPRKQSLAPSFSFNFFFDTFCFSSFASFRSFFGFFLFWDNGCSMSQLTILNHNSAKAIS